VKFDGQRLRGMRKPDSDISEAPIANPRWSQKAVVETVALVANIRVNMSIFNGVDRTPKNFNPTVGSCHPANMRLSRSRTSQLSCHNQTDPPSAEVNGVYLHAGGKMVV
jgi:hypothetical protein